jgi:two-component system chemotaxis response regulator CheY
MAKILIVDDSNLSRRISRGILQDGGYEVVEADDGIAALERYFLDKPDAVLLDITMKGMNGIEVLKKLRELDPQARVVIATADIQSSTRALTQEAGAAGFITKPLAADRLLKALSAALQGEP